MEKSCKERFYHVKRVGAHKKLRFVRFILSERKGKVGKVCFEPSVPYRPELIPVSVALSD